MDFRDFCISPNNNEYEVWQIGSLLTDELKENSIVLIFCSDERGNGGIAEQKDFSNFRNTFYAMPKGEIRLPIYDLGDLISGNTKEDTQCIIEEVVAECCERRFLPIVIGGSNDVSYALYKALEKVQSRVAYTQVNSFINLGVLGNDGISEENYLTKIMNDSSSLKDYAHLGYQKHLNRLEIVGLLSDMGFDVLRLADMISEMGNAEPFFRRANLVTLNCDVVESTGFVFSRNPQVNGLNNREICACAKEIGMGEELKVFGMFNFNTLSDNILSYQLLSQMLWYFLEGVNIERTHPQNKELETYIVMVENLEYVFKRDSFSGKWYFGDNRDIKRCIPCTEKDYENAKKGFLASRFYR